MKKIQHGVICEVVGGTDNLNVGKHVVVNNLRGQHSELGNIWRCSVVKGSQLVTEFGGIGIAADFAESWLRPIDDTNDQTKQVTRRSEPVYNKAA
jgi:hypothetical protein